MTFRLALSGLNAASADLGVTANNIANSSTTGFTSVSFTLYPEEETEKLPA